MTSIAIIVRALAGVLAGGAPARAADGWYAVSGQATYVQQPTDGFHAPYAGPNSLTPRQGRETVDATLFLGVRLWRGAELWANPEMDQGFGLDDTVGLAGARTISEASPNQFADELFSDRIVVTVGKVEPLG